MKQKIMIPILLFLICPLWSLAQENTLTVTAENNLDIGRQNEAIILSKNELQSLGETNLQRIHVKNAAGSELLCQTIDTTGDHFADGVLFQADFAPNQVRHFYVYVGNQQLYTKEQYKAFGRFFRERFDDFAWENDRIAQRTYGKALKTWKGGPLTSSTIDVWAKNTEKLVLNDWYLTAHYHMDWGKGADLYSSGSTRGVGADAVWNNNKLWAAENFTHSFVYGKGPIRVSFKLDYEDFNVNGQEVKESRHIILDAGHNLNHFQVSYKTNIEEPLQVAAGIQTSNQTPEEVRKGLEGYHRNKSVERHPGKALQKDMNKEEGWITMEQPLSEGKLYSAIIVDPEDLIKFTREGKNVLAIVQLEEDNKFSYLAGYSWSRSGQFEDYEAWKAHIAKVAQGLQSPIKITVE